jgi:hypothetical protein
LEIWTIGGTRTASSRLRIHQYAPLLAADDLIERIRAIPHGFASRLGLFARLAPGRRLLVQKKLFSPRLLVTRAGGTTSLRCRRRGISTRREHAKPRRFRRVTEAADRVVAESTLAAACADPGRAVVVPPVDLRRVTPGPPELESRPPYGSEAAVFPARSGVAAWERVPADRGALVVRDRYAVYRPGQPAP